MTDIPGTGKLSSEAEIPIKEYLGPQEGSIKTINVKQLKKDKTFKPKQEDKLWYNQLHYWILFGFMGSVVFAVLGIFHKQFFLLVLVGPIAGLLTWLIKKLFRRYNLHSEEHLK